MAERYENNLFFRISLRLTNKISKAIRRAAEPVRSSCDYFLLSCTLCETESVLRFSDNGQGCIYLHRNKSHATPSIAKHPIILPE